MRLESFKKLLAAARQSMGLRVVFGGGLTDQADGLAVGLDLHRIQKIAEREVLSERAGFLGSSTCRGGAVDDGNLPLRQDDSVERLRVR